MQFQGDEVIPLVEGQSRSWHISVTHPFHGEACPVNRVSYNVTRKVHRTNYIHGDVYPHNVNMVR